MFPHGGSGHGPPATRAEGTRASRSPGAAARNGGFTLIELLMSLLIIAVMAAVAAPAFLDEAEPADLDAAQGRLEALFRLARDSAVRTATPVTVVLDSASGLVWLDARSRLAADLPVEVEWETGGGTPAAGNAGNGPIRLRAEGVFGGGSTLGRGVAGVGGTLRPPAGGEPLDLPATVSMELYQVRPRFTFAPSGAVVGDSIRLRGPNGESRLVTLDPWNGRVRVR